ncbi:MAG: hypothetical protein MZU79_07455 [Anaerotruncus sp.]|nr:hypothetical protein [Anaerotruncus sp.]
MLEYPAKGHEEEDPALGVALPRPDGRRLGHPADGLSAPPGPGLPHPQLFPDRHPVEPRPPDLAGRPVPGRPRLLQERIPDAHGPQRPRPLRLPGRHPLRPDLSSRCSSSS